MTRAGERKPRFALSCVLRKSCPSRLITVALIGDGAAGLPLGREPHPRELSGLFHNVQVITLAFVRRPHHPETTSSK